MTPGLYRSEFGMTFKQTPSLVISFHVFGIVLAFSYGERSFQTCSLQAVLVATGADTLAISFFMNSFSVY